MVSNRPGIPLQRPAAQRNPQPALIRARLDHETGDQQPAGCPGFSVSMK